MKLMALSVIVLSSVLVAASASAQECAPACRAGYVCQAGQCVSACNPACEGGTTCAQSATGQFGCVANAPPPPPSTGYGQPAGYAQPGYGPPPPGYAMGMRRVHVEDNGLVIGGWVTFAISYAVSIPIWFIGGLYGPASAIFDALAFIPFVNGASTLFLGTIGQIVGVILLIIGYIGHDQDVPMGMAKLGDVTFGVTPVVAPNTGGLALSGFF